jgi:hypothetical protein
MAMVFRGQCKHDWEQIAVIQGEHSPASSMVGKGKERGRQSGGQAVVLDHEACRWTGRSFNISRNWNLRKGHTSRELEAGTSRVLFRAERKGEAEIPATRIMALET